LALVATCGTHFPAVSAQYQPHEAPSQASCYVEVHKLEGLLLGAHSLAAAVVEMVSCSCSSILRELTPRRALITMSDVFILCFYLFLIIKLLHSA